ncbi:TetR/AcrR family transcriptional regulator [Kibdelosporangium philippinense]|uniref:TetR/AcrR family transcriptional regulator n=1 Tax=Kibdelosporangium philippinense TaxID=211113 RepID=A0ABS8ZGN9_9PSEU|nr:TetR/AcrR family transcriptional regulator [Kibdelosporangium philippinense]MCE7005816.1 TetR/AcrR family transcriptional regulator [Kibdelosporangium philippinense]
MTARPLRADAQRNRDRLIEAAVEAFSQGGTDEVTLEAIAKDAGVGIGTLYRHFPTREALVDAAYRDELTKLIDSAAELLGSMAPDVALRTWMDHFVAYMITKQGMGDALKALIASGGNPFADSRERLKGALKQLLDASIAAGTIRADIDAWDMLVSLSGVALAGDQAKHEQIGRLLDLLLDGLRFRR